jgi:hypothetical protein
VLARVRERERDKERKREGERAIECGCAEFSFLCLQGCAHTLHRSERERGREREREGERCRIWLLNLINNHKVKKETPGALAPFSYLVL